MSRARCIFAILPVTWSLISCIPSPQKPKDDKSWDLPQKVMPTQELENSCNTLYQKNKRGKRLSWKGAVPVTFLFDSSFPPDYVPAVQAAADLWNAAAGLTMIKLGGYRSDSSLPAADRINTIYFFSNTSSESAKVMAKTLFPQGGPGGHAGKDGGVAVTEVNFLGNRIFDSDISFNGIAFNFSTWRLRFNAHDITSVALHEFGHAMGLNHNESPLSVMFPYGSSMGIAFRSLDNEPKHLLYCEYETAKP